MAQESIVGLDIASSGGASNNLDRAPRAAMAATVLAESIVDLMALWQWLRSRGAAVRGRAEKEVLLWATESLSWHRDYVAYCTMTLLLCTWRCE